MKDKQDNRPVWFKGTMPEDWVTRFTVGNDFVWDTMLLPFDITATVAHVKGLVKAEIMTQEESNDVENSLLDLRVEWDKGNVQVTVEDEDCHSVIERWLIDALGEVGKKVHTARSRNDQVLAALRLWIRAQLDEIVRDMSVLGNGLLDFAESEKGVFLPGYTHMQRAMPSSVGLWAAGFAEALADDLDYAKEARSHANISPLGSAAGFAVPNIPLDRAFVAELLGFDRVQQNVTSVQLSRGKVELGVVHALLQTAITINRLASDLVLYSMSEFGFVRFEPGLTTGSSIMPQKSNPDVAELARAAMHRIAAEAQVLISVPANLPSGYHRDLQTTKEAVMRAVTAAAQLVGAMIQLMAGVSFDRNRLEASRDADLFATAAAMARVATGQPFRQAYQDVVGKRDEWLAAAQQSLEDSYLYDGAPGRPDIQSIRDRLNRK